MESRSDHLPGLHAKYFFGPFNSVLAICGDPESFFRGGPTLTTLFF